jgi:hypothetical protein
VIAPTLIEQTGGRSTEVEWIGIGVLVAIIVVAAVLIGTMSERRDDRSRHSRSYSGSGYDGSAGWGGSVGGGYSDCGGGGDGGGGSC